MMSIGIGLLKLLWISWHWSLLHIVSVLAMDWWISPRLTLDWQISEYWQSGKKGLALEWRLIENG